jgi:Sushi repeat (SCR repeat)
MWVLFLTSGAAYECPEVAVTEGTVRDTEENQYNTVATYRCLDGYRFHDGTTVRTLICLSTGHWQSITPSCERAYFKPYHFKAIVCNC